MSRRSRGDRRARDRRFARRPFKEPARQGQASAPERQPKSNRSPKRGRASRATQREVFERDGERCTCVGPDGKRCDATAFLELDHIDSRALGGGDDSPNLRVRCRAHNRLWAEQTFGKEHVERRIHFRQQKSILHDERFRPTEDDAAEAEKWDKLLGALTHSGFAPKQARRALALLRGGDGPVSWSSPVDELLRAALQVLTCR